MLSPKRKRQFSQILPFGVIWLVFGIIFLTIEHTATLNCAELPVGVIDLDYSIIIFALIAVTLVGFSIGLIEMLVINQLFAKKSFLIKIIGKLLIYSVFLFLIICITYPIAASLELETSVVDSRVWHKFSIFLNSITFLSTAFQMAISLFATLFYAEISESMGSSVFINFISGRYHKPKEESRIFMFLDMKSSTSIAEKIGHSQYFKLLKEYYYILSESIIEYSGEIYQYVGDEMVISWNLSEGLKNNNCVHCFFHMEKDLLKKRTSFVHNFGLYPEFKAGLHFGDVTVGEIGRLKKEIIFTGDVLNTTARIQGFCNYYNADFLISSDLLNKLDIQSEFQVQSHGHNILRGKTEPMELFSIREK